MNPTIFGLNQVPTLGLTLDCVTLPCLALHYFTYCKNNITVTVRCHYSYVTRTLSLYGIYMTQK